MCPLKDVSRHRQAFLFIRLEQGDGSFPLMDEGQFPGKVIGILNTCVHTLTTKGAVDMGSITGEKDMTDEPCFHTASVE